MYTILGTVHIVGFGLPYLDFGQCVKKVVVGHLVNSQPVVEDEQTFTRRPTTTFFTHCPKPKYGRPKPTMWTVPNDQRRMMKT